MPRWRNSRDARTLPISGRSFASAITALSALDAAIENYDSTMPSLPFPWRAMASNSQRLLAVLVRQRICREVGRHFVVDDTLEVRLIVGAAATLVHGFVWILAHLARTHRAARQHLPRHHVVRRNAFLDPVLQRVEQHREQRIGVRLRRCAAGAVADARVEERAHERLRLSYPIPIKHPAQVVIRP